jgi:hypothetical protein
MSEAAVEMKGEVKGWEEEGKEDEVGQGDEEGGVGGLSMEISRCGAAEEGQAEEMEGVGDVGEGGSVDEINLRAAGAAKGEVMVEGGGFELESGDFAIEVEAMLGAALNVEFALVVGLGEGRGGIGVEESFGASEFSGGELEVIENIGGRGLA